jgi:hypothetical protein
VGKSRVASSGALVVALCCMSVSTCAYSSEALRPLELARKGFILSGLNGRNGYANNALTIFDASDPAKWSIAKRVSLPRSRARYLSRDPIGRLWIGLPGMLDHVDDLVNVYSEDGQLLKSLHPCLRPAAGITFGAGKAFVACSEMGFHGRIVSFDLQALSPIQDVQLTITDASYFIQSSYADDDFLVIAGGISPVDPSKRKSLSGDSMVTILDSTSLSVLSQVRLADSDIWRIRRRLEKFYLLNTGSWIRDRSEGTANDVLVLTPGSVPSIELLALAPSSYVGDIAGNVLWTFHNPTLNQPNSDPRRQISRLDLVSGERMIWPLPMNWRVDDLKLVDGRIILARWRISTDDEDGLYEFDPSTGQAKMILNVPDASQVIVEPRIP